MAPYLLQDIKGHMVMEEEAEVDKGAEVLEEKGPIYHQHKHVV